MKPLLLALALVPFIAPQVQAADGQAVYEKHCKACHVQGLGGAPKPGDKAAWAPRIAQGDAAMLATVKKGKSAMPPKGTCFKCDDAGLSAAIQVFVDHVK